MRVIGYSDLRKLNLLKEWDEIRSYPHLCVSKTLKDALIKIYGREKFRAITPIYKITRKLYKEWMDNKRGEVDQYFKIRKLILEIKDENLKKSYLENISEVYKAIRLVLELGIDSNIKEKENYTLDKEKEEFLKLLKKVEKLDEWKWVKSLNNKYIGDLNDAILEDLKRENPLEIEFLDELIEEYQFDSIDKVVIHGVHKFTPAILRFIDFLLKNDIEVIFMINYNENFKKIYSTWEKVYSWTCCEIEKNQFEDNYKHKDIAKNYASIIEGKLEELTETENIEVIKFNNYTELSNYIIDKYVKSKNSINTTTKKDILKNMEEQFYAVDDTKINDILKLYFPEQYGRKHFLSYPIGNLILSLHKLWNDKIFIKEELLEDILSINIWSDKINPIEIFRKIKIYFKDLENKEIEEYLNRIENLKLNLKSIEKSNNKDYKKISYFNVTLEEIDEFENIIIDIKNIVKALIEKEEEKPEKHYKNILEFLQSKINDEREEVNLIKEILEILKTSKTEESQPIKALEETMNFFLAQNKENDEIKRIVKDFNQIEGGAVLANYENEKIYHYIEVSDGAMQNKDKINIPWPLDEDFFGKNIEKLNIINTSRTEYKNYLRYALFYGLYYIENNKIKISYVSNREEGKKDSLYYILKMLNLKEKELDIKDSLKDKAIVKSENKNLSIYKSDITKMDIINFRYCEKRFFFESLIDKEGDFNGEFLIKQYLNNFISISIYNKKSKINIKEGIKKVAPFLKGTEIEDLNYSIDRRLNYLKNNNKSESIPQNYEFVLKNYLKAKFVGNNEEDTEEILTKYIFESNYNLESRKNKVLDYINNSVDIERSVIFEKCIYCRYRHICLAEGGIN